MKKILESKPEQDCLYLVEFGPNSEHILEKQIVKDLLEKVLYQCAQESGWTIDSCDVLPDYIAMTIYVHPSVDIDNAIILLKKQSSHALIKEFIEFKQYLINDSLWDEGYDIELLEGSL